MLIKQSSKGNWGIFQTIETTVKRYCIEKCSCPDCSGHPKLKEFTKTVLEPLIMFGPTSFAYEQALEYKTKHNL